MCASCIITHNYDGARGDSIYIYIYIYIYRNVTKTGDIAKIFYALVRGTFSLNGQYLNQIFRRGYDRVIGGVSTMNQKWPVSPDQRFSGPFVL